VKKKKDSAESRRTPTRLSSHGQLPPLGALRFLYVSSKDVDEDARYYEDVMGAEILWKVSDSGATVAAVRISGDSVLLLLAGHQPSPSCEPIYEVDDLKSTATM